MSPPSSSQQMCIKSFLLNLSSSFPTNWRKLVIMSDPAILYHITYLKVNCAIYQSNHGSKIHHIHSPKGHTGHVHERDGQSQWTILEFCLPQGEAPNCLSSRSHRTLIYFCLILLSLEVPIWTTWMASDWSWLFNLFFQTQWLKNSSCPPPQWPT